MQLRIDSITNFRGKAYNKDGVVTKVIKQTEENIPYKNLSLDNAILIHTLKTSLNALKANIAYETVNCFSKAWSINANVEEILASRKYSNIPESVDKCINEIVSKAELDSNPELYQIVETIKIDTLSDIANILTFH